MFSEDLLCAGLADVSSCGGDEGTEAGHQAGVSSDSASATPQPGSLGDGRTPLNPGVHVGLMGRPSGRGRAAGRVNANKGLQWGRCTHVHSQQAAVTHKD